MEILNENKLDEPLTRICGATSNYFFLAGKNAQWILMMSRDLKEKDTFLVNVQNPTYLAPPNNLVVDSPNIYLYINNRSLVLTANLKNTKIDSINLKTNIFTKSCQISKSRFLVRAFDSTFSEQPFYIVNSLDGKVQNSLNPLHSMTSDDAGFGSDGILKSNMDKIVYAQYYRNAFYCMDTNLNLLYTSSTIDTVQTNNLHFKNIHYKSERRIMSTKARTLVNKDLCVDNQYIYIYSALRADNETEKVNKENSIIDVYQLSNGHYIGSFKIPNINDEKVKKFMVAEKSLIALYKNHIASYKFDITNK